MRFSFPPPDLFGILTRQMKLMAGMHLGFCTNGHRGETWAETFEALKNHTLLVRDRVCPGQPYGIGLRLSNQAAFDLSERPVLVEFQRWLARNHCYVFTLNGFVFGPTHGRRIKEHAYEPDWASPERLIYTKLLFDLLSQLVPPGTDGSVSTLPASYKGFHPHPEDVKMARANLWSCVEHVARISERSGRQMHLGLEPEPLCLLESSGETIQFFDRLRAEHPRDARLADHLGVNYDTCHFAVEFEEPGDALGCLQQHGIKISKIHLSAALKVAATPEARAALAALADDGWLHQVVVCRPDGQRFIYWDLAEALADEAAAGDGAEGEPAAEWRIHFHVAAHHAPTSLFGNTADHILGVLDLLAANPGTCSHLEMETTAWALPPPGAGESDLVEEWAGEYGWTLARLRERNLA
jgi:sugar phosphate isomerase/epimerase